PFNVAYVLPLKCRYGNKISALVYNYTYYILKEVFLLVFKVVYNKKNIYIGFKVARLVLYNLDIVLLKLDIKLYTPTLL
ncbi:hypothetical protein K432DRAFT_314828, partial [Lepidopterella palustris CBS 459.81]